LANLFQFSSAVTGLQAWAGGMSVSVWHCGSKIVENRGVTTDEAGDKKLDAKVALK
jgi:hypothetical protein